MLYAQRLMKQEKNSVMLKMRNLLLTAYSVFSQGGRKNTKHMILQDSKDA